MSIEALARRAGIEARYHDAFGRTVTASRETLVSMLQALGHDVHDDGSASLLSSDLERRDAKRPFRRCYSAVAGTALAQAVPETEHQTFALYDESGSAATSLDEPGYYELCSPRGERSSIIVAPRMAYQPPQFAQRGGWAVAAQLYALSGARTQGIGDFGSLGSLARIAAQHGSWAIGLNPLHQLDLARPGTGSPYSPVSRLLLNSLYIDVREAAAFLDVDSEQVARHETLIDYDAVARAKRSAFSRLYQAFDALSHDAPRDARVTAYHQFAAHAPHVVELACYEAALERGDRALGPGDEQRAPYYVFLQWLAERQLGQAAKEASAMPIGLYRDLAVGVGMDSADVLRDPRLFAGGLSIGAPPDPLNELGQDWSLPPLHPGVLRERCYAPFAEVLRANMRHAGALRIDHVMSLQRLYCIPRGDQRGAYLHYDFDTMLAICKLESARARCMVVGEDLGTVPDGFRTRLRDAGIFSCTVLSFERDKSGAFRSPSTYPAQSVASTGTHDLAPVAGYVNACDVDTRERLGWIAPAAALEARADRMRSLQQLGEALVDAGSSAEMPRDDQAWIAALYAFLGASASRLVLVQLEDVFAQREQVNVPGTLEQEPNWRRMLPQPVEALASHTLFTKLATIMARAGRAAGEDAP